MMDIYEGH